MAVATSPAAARREDLRFVTGQGRYVGDRHPPGMLHAAMVRSPHARARITAIDTSGARGEGVVSVMTGADLAALGLEAIPGASRFGLPDGRPAPETPRPILARDRVRHMGEPVAVVIAETRAQAIDAAERVVVTYDSDGDAVVHPADALREGASRVWETMVDNVAFVWSGGDAALTEAALRAAAHVTTLRTPITRVSANTLEPRVFLAEPEDDGRLTVHASHQNPYQLRGKLFELGFSQDGTRVIVEDVGGSFGMKGGLAQEVVAAAVAARTLRRPVLWESDRSEAFLSDEHGRQMDLTVEIGFDRDHRIVALKARMDVNLGAYASDKSGWGVNNVGGIAGVYRIPHIRADVYGVLTNTVPTSAYRGAGRPEATYAIERSLDLAARELGLSPFELRRTNLIPPSEMPYKTALVFTYDCGEFEGNMRAAEALADLAGIEARREEAARNGKILGVGLCNCIEVAGGPIARLPQDFASLTLTETGKLVLVSGSVSVGQGYETAFPRLVAERFGISADQVEYRQGDTDALPGGRGNGGSGSLCVGGSAVVKATDAVIAKARRLAAHLLEADAADVALHEGSFRVEGQNRFVGLAELAEAAHDPARNPTGELGLSAVADFQPPGVTFPNGTHVCEVEIDRETGTVEVVRYSAVEDIGRVLYPVLVDGQMHGGIAQGIGQALGEAIAFDEAGQLVTGSFMDYRMPRAADLPLFRTEHRSVPTKVNPLGVKGVGEAGTVGALAATMNAVNDALASLGIRQFDMPATPGRVWAAIQAAGAGSGADPGAA